MNWRIEYNPKPIRDRRHDYDFWHPDREDWGGTAESVEEARERIKEVDPDAEFT